MNEKEEKLKLELNELFEKRAKHPEASKYAMSTLFPKVAKALSVWIDNKEENYIAIAKHRAAVKATARNYFTLQPARGVWGKDQITAILKSKNPLEALANAIELIERASEFERLGLRRMLLEILPTAFGTEGVSVQSWLLAINKESKYFISQKDETAGLFYSNDNLDRLRWILNSGLRLLSPEDRDQLLGQAILASPDISLLCDWFRVWFGDLHPEGAKNKDPENMKLADSGKIRQLLLTKTYEIAHSSQIWFQASPAEIIWFWWGCDREHDVREYFDRAMNEEALALRLMELSISIVRSTSGNYEQVNLKSWSKIFDPARAIKIAESILSRDAGETEIRLAQRFLNAVAAFDENKYR